MRRKYIVYNITMAVLSLIIAIVLILQLTLDLSREVSMFLTAIDFIIWMIFAIDYVVRFKRSRNKKKFVKKNLIDLVAITPLYSIFKVFNILRVLRIGRIARLSELTKIIRVLAIMRRTNKNLSEFMQTNNFNYTLGIAMIIVFSGSIMMSYVEKISLGSAIWWSIVTFTTVGYGDIYPETTLGRITASILMIMGIGFIGSVTSTFSSYFIKKEEDKNRAKIESINEKEKALKADIVEDIEDGDILDTDKNNIETKAKIDIKTSTKDNANRNDILTNKQNKLDYNLINNNIQNNPDASDENINYKEEVVSDIIDKLRSFEDLSGEEVKSICNILQALKN